jgi:hypothetical protein
VVVRGISGSRFKIYQENVITNRRGFVKARTAVSYKGTETMRQETQRKVHFSFPFSLRGNAGGFAGVRPTNGQRAGLTLETSSESNVQPPEATSFKCRQSRATAQQRRPEASLSPTAQRFVLRRFRTKSEPNATSGESSNSRDAGTGTARYSVWCRTKAKRQLSASAFRV